MKLKKIFFSLFLVLLILLSIPFSAFAAVKIDASIDPDEFEDTNLEVQCDKGNRGNGLYVLVTYYKTLPGRSQIYLAFNAELYGEEVLVDGPFGFEIYIEDTPVIRIGTNSHADFDASYYHVQVSNRTDFSSMRCETLITFKNHMPDTPTIYVRVIDNNGVPSERFKINTTMSEPTTEETTKAKEESTTKKTTDQKPSFDFSLPFSSETTTKTTNNPSQDTDETRKSNSSAQTEKRTTQSNDTSGKSDKKHNATKRPSSSNKDENQKGDSVTLHKNEESVAHFEIENEASEYGFGTGKKRSIIIAISACTIVAAITGSAFTVMKSKGKK